MQDNISTIDKNKILILTETDKEIDPMFNAWLEAGYDADILFTPVQSKVLRAFRRLWLEGIIPGASIWYNTWKKQLDNYNMIIIHASELTRTIPRWIRKQSQNMRVIYWYWNPVNSKSLPALINDDRTECWSFDKADCKQYGMKQNIQYYYGDRNDTMTDTEYDVYFVGHDKGRAKKLQDIKTTLDEQGITYKFDVIKESSPNIPYNTVRANIRKTKAILEINQAGQEGYTLRALEALFFQKKLITSNVSLKKEKFYNPSNIYILNQEDTSIKDFMDAPFVDTSSFIREYNIDAWVSNFINSKEQ